jgi:outer membrane protein
VTYQYLSSVEDVYNTALGIHPEIKSYDLKYSSSEIGLKIAQGARMPRLTLNGGITTGYSSARSLSLVQTSTQQVNIGYLQSNPSEIVSTMSNVSVVTRSDYPFLQQLNDNFAQNVSLNLSVPILNNHVYYGNIQRAKIYMANARLQQQSIRNQLRQEIEQSYAEMKAAEANYKAAEDQYKSAESTYRVMEKRYQAGAVNATELLIAKNNYLSSNTELVQAKYEYLFKIKVLEFLKNGSVI